MIIIKLDDIDKSFNGINLFKNVNVQFEKGKIYGINGPNGSGKSVLFKLICGFLKPDNGKVIIADEYLDKKNDFPKNFGLLIDRPGYISNKTGFENLKRLAEIKNTHSDESIKNTMNKLGLDWETKQQVKYYSVGMKQKLSIAQAIMEDQEVLMLDEPFNGLDKESVLIVRNLLAELNSQGRTILLTSHNQEDIDILCDEVFEINNLTLNK